jgi:cytochrome c oxidase subunit III
MLGKIISICWSVWFAFVKAEMELRKEVSKRLSKSKDYWWNTLNEYHRIFNPALNGKAFKSVSVTNLKKNVRLPSVQTPEITSQIHKRHYFNHIEYSPWPYYISIWTSALIFFFLAYLNKYSSVQPYTLLLLLGGLFIQIERWNSDIIIESTYLGRYNKKIHSSLVIGFGLFLLSEIMLFSGFFWAFFDRIFFVSSYVDNITRLSPTSHPWVPVDWYRLPILGTFLLVSSGYLCNWGYYGLKLGLDKVAYFCFVAGIVFGFFFLLIQEFEYLEFKTTISDGVFSSLFFLLTGFHGMHVLVGLLMLTTQTDRLRKVHFSTQRATGLSFALIYWHFVDIIWIFLFFFVYMFNNAKQMSIVSSSLEDSFFLFTFVGKGYIIF